MAIVPLFKEQLENESQAIATSRELTKRGDNLIWWYFLKLEQLSHADIEEIICDGYNDLGIDAIWIDEDSIVHFYSFKNPQSIAEPFPPGDVDKLLSGLTLILSKRADKIANPALRDRIQEIYRTLPTAYRIHLVTSGTGMTSDTPAKMAGFIESLKPPSDEFCTWSIEDIQRLQEAFYQKSLPTVDEALEIGLPRSPYQVRSANHDCYMFDMPGSELAALYGRFGEQLLQQNIRVYQGDRSTNALIKKTGTGPESGNFFHYNNGVVFLAETAQWDGFTGRLSLRRFQVVNGGQTIRVLHQAGKELRRDVSVPVRAITSQGDKDFANNVTVNLNNQNRIEPSFLRSNDPRVIQLANALASEGWYLERRENEVNTLTPIEHAEVEIRIGRPLGGRTIRLKEGMQAYVATFLRQPELAKKNPKRIFLGANDGGIFDRVFAADMTAQKVISAHMLASLVSEYVKQFMTRKRRKDKVADWQADYQTLLGASLMKKHHALVDQVIPQSAVFLSAITYEEWVNIRHQPLVDLLDTLAKHNYAILNSTVELIIDLETGAKSWPTLLKSQSLFDEVANFLRGRISGKPPEPQQREFEL